MLVEAHQEGEIFPSLAGGGELLAGYVLETKFGDSMGGRARKAGSLSHRRKVTELGGAPGGMHDASGNGFDAEPADGGKGAAGHGLCGEVGSELQQSKRVDALRALLEGCDGEFARGGAGGRKNQNFRLRSVGGEEGSGPCKEFRVGSRPENRTGHKQLSR